MRTFNTIFAFNYPFLAFITLIASLLFTTLHASEYQTAINLATQGNAIELKNFLNELPADKLSKVLETRNTAGDTPLITAARQGNLAIIDVLLLAGANINVLDAKKRDIVNIAISTKNTELALKAIASGADVTMVTSIYQGSALIYASAQGEAEIVKALLGAGAPVNRVNNIGWTALLEATILGDGSTRYQEIVSHLLKAGADKDIADRKGMTPLDHATSKGHTTIIKLLSSQ